MIYETIITTRNPDGGVHIAPMGITKGDNLIVVAPFRPSTTLDNLHRTRQAVINMTDDVSIVAGCLTGRRDWPTVPAQVVDGERLAAALAPPASTMRASSREATLASIPVMPHPPHLRHHA